MYNRSISFKVFVLKATSYINYAIIDFQLSFMVPYVDIIGLCHSVAILWEIHVIRHIWESLKYIRQKMSYKGGSPKKGPYVLRFKLCSVN